MSYMGWVGTIIRLLGQLAFAAFALGLGVALSRFTDLARYDRARPIASFARAAREGREGLLISRASASATPAPEPRMQLDLPELALEQPELADPQPPEGLGEAFRDGLVMRGSTRQRLILFTFDDGPDRTTTPILLDRLDAAGVRGVFFLTGENLRGENLAERRNRDIARETVRRGHIVASHGMHHRQLPLLGAAEAALEISQAEQMFQQVLGARPWLVRPPGGSRSPRIDRMLAERGYTTMLWNLGAGDTQVHTAEEVHRTWAAVLERRRAAGDEGGIVLLHDTYAWSVDAFQLIVNDLLDRNCKLLAAGEELYDFVDDPRLFFQPRGSADPSSEAAPVTLSRAHLELRQARLRQETAQRCESLAER
jgi:peptidoglycan/xylan/chitin deacetylase (PgdA/CDA1 family)